MFSARSPAFLLVAAGVACRFCPVGSSCGATCTRFRLCLCWDVRKTAASRAMAHSVSESKKKEREGAAREWTRERNQRVA